MRARVLASEMLFVAIVCGCGQAPAPQDNDGLADQKQSRETLHKNGYDEQEMEAAIARARAEVDSFIKELADGTATDFSVKAPISDKGEIEHFWLTNVVYKNGEFEGAIGNEPGTVRNVKFGQKWTIKKSEISDWLYMRAGKMYGNYTVRPLLKTMPKEQAERVKSMLANP